MIDERLIASPQKEQAKRAGQAQLARVTLGVKKHTGLETKAERLQRKEDEAERAHFWTVVHVAVAGFVMAVSFAAAYMLPVKLVEIAMIFPIVLAPYVVVQRRELDKLGSLRKALNLVRQEVNRMDDENVKLTQVNTMLEKDVSKLQICEQKLNSIVEHQGMDVNRFLTLMKENRDVQHQIAETLRARVLQDVINIILRSDKEGDFQLDGREINILILRMRHLYGMNIDEDEFRLALRERSVGVGHRRRTSVGAVVAVTKSMLAKSLVDESSIFIPRNANLSARRMATAASPLTPPTMEKAQGVLA